MDIVSESLAELSGSLAGVWDEMPAELGCVRLAVCAESVGVARRFTELVLKRFNVLDDVREDVVMVVSELVTNAVMHGGDYPDQHVLLVLLRSGATLHLKVYDSDSRMGPRQQPSGDSESGRGLVIVNALAERWGVRELSVGKCVWAEVDAWPVLPGGPKA
jgi:anti-sigma regulatory factor (Ser/Thr protein kinase)